MPPYTAFILVMKLLGAVGSPTPLGMLVPSGMMLYVSVMPLPVVPALPLATAVQRLDKLYGGLAEFAVEPLLPSVFFVLMTPPLPIVVIVEGAVGFATSFVGTLTACPHPQSGGAMEIVPAITLASSRRASRTSACAR